MKLVVAKSLNDTLGNKGSIPWKQSADLKRFKQLTMGHTILMGRKTWDSIGFPLPGRKSVVLSRQSGLQIPGATVINRLSDLNSNDVFVIGGAEIYKICEPFCDEMFVTTIVSHIQGDTHFPRLDWRFWRLMEYDPHPADEHNEFPYEFRKYERICR